jgi:hypothetical protein
MGIENKVTYGLEVAMWIKWPKNHVDLKDDTYETLVLVHTKEQNALVLNVRGPREVQKESNLPY